MFSFRGDVHKFYLKVKKNYKKNQNINHLKEIKEINKLRTFYQKLSIKDLTNIRYRMLKEQNAMGIIPLLFGSLPWLGFIFSKQLQNLLFKDGTYLWAWFLIIYSGILTIGLILHYREKAWASLHIEIIDDTISEKQKNEKKKSSQ